MHYIESEENVSKYILVEMRNDYKLSALFNKLESPYHRYIMSSMDAALGELCVEVQSCNLAYASQYRALMVFFFTGKTNELWFGSAHDKRTSYLCSKMTLYFNKVLNYRMEMESPSIDASSYKDTFDFAKDYIKWRKDRLSFYEMKDKSIFVGSSQELTLDELKTRLKMIQSQDYNRLITDYLRLNSDSNCSSKKQKQLVSMVSKMGIDPKFPEWTGAFGMLAFKAPKLFNEGKENQTLRTKWTCDRNLPLFKAQPDFLDKIFSSQ